MKYKFINSLYKWLPIICGCHCRDDRSFHYKGMKFPVCARCTGILLGWILCLITYWFVDISILWLLLMIIPLMADGLIQHFTSYESGNLRRLFTGVLFGYGTIAIFLYSAILAYNMGLSIGRYIKG